ncbi:unnamed protein product [Rotaria socialis]|uniref:MYND-type domain-containing protein n=1 Tax=Rotaria socialis TaxID=392032 RepID=A0A821JLF4_9BILA|nr:unnamed protein product [Rotaria socialis]CAF4719847.1 unnamed protein product [Rotaria socialis]
MSTLINGKNQEQSKDIDEDKSDKKPTTSASKNNVGKLVDENKAKITSVSIGVGRDIPSPNGIKTYAKSTVIEDSCKYKGDLYDDKKHGIGILSWSDGRMYNGAFFADKRHGFGTFETSDLSEFKGLYRQDERFGPGILIYKSMTNADVGFWLSEDLVRILQRHPNLNFDICITDKKCTNKSSFTIPSWYSPQELLATTVDLDSILKKKSNALFCKSIEEENISLKYYLIDRSDQVEEAIHEKRAQLDAYLASLNNDDILKEKILTEHIADIIPPNETFEQKQLYYYINKFWPLKQRATFPIDEILSNTRSCFPNPGPLENSSMFLFESAFHGETKTVRDLLMHHQVYVDVCDSRGLTALHLAIYNVQINVVNLLLDFGANVNQLSDDGLTSLAIAFLLYYGNDPQTTMNTALEHLDPVLMALKTVSVLEARRSSPKDRAIQQSRATMNTSRNLLSRASTITEDKVVSSSESIKINEIENKNPYGYELSSELRERIEDEHLRQLLHSLIKLLLRRGADPCLSDWPLPVLALAVRAGDKEMVGLLLKKKAQVNCRLSATRLSYLTPLHIACGCLSSNAIDIARQLLQHGAHVNAESSPGGQEYLSLAEPLAVDANKLNRATLHGRTPLHIACTREATDDTLSLVRLLLEHHADPNAVCNGQTPLSLAIILGNEPLVDLLIEHDTTDPSTFLGLGNGNALCTVLSTNYESRWTYAKRLQLIEHFIAKNPQVLYPVRFGPKNTLGSSVDYAYYSFFADAKISQTPYHSLLPQERIIYKERKELLVHIAKRFREEVTKLEDFLRLPTPIPGSRETPSSNMFVQRVVSRARSFVTERSGDINSKASNEFHYCATCGRSTGVRLTLCKRCQQVYFCSKACKVAGWNTFHRLDCETPNQASLAERPITTTKTISSKNQLPSLRPSTHQTELTQFQSVDTSGTRAENFTALDNVLFKESVFSPKTPQNTHNNARLPRLSVAQLIRQKRLKKNGKLGGNLPPTLPASLQGVPLSWNSTYNAPENYSFN